MGKKDKKDGAKKEAKKARQAAKQQKSDQKRTKKELKDTGERDIESILAEYAERESKKVAVAVTTVGQPSRRVNFTMTALPSGEMLMFGGEFFDGETTTVYNELFKWNVDRNEWKQIESLNTPPPRCSHQAVLYQDKLYIFGGEYGTLDQFYHYRDLWELDLKTSTWREVTATGDWPSARSGHRMILWRNFIVLFGGFYEAMRDVRWYNDLYFFSLQECRWIAVNPRQTGAIPKPRSGHMMFLHQAEDLVYVYGGFAKEKTPGAKKEHIEHEDMWSMSLKPIVQSKHGSSASTSALEWGKLSWQRVSKKGEYPTARCGAVATVFKNKALVFGGVFDEEGPRHALLSSFYNDLFAFDMDRKRWYKLGLKHVKDKIKIKEEKAAKKQQRKIATAQALAAARAKILAVSSDAAGSSEGMEVEDGLSEVKFRKVGYFEEDEEDDEDGDEEDDDFIIDGLNGDRVAASSVSKNAELFGFIDDNGDVVYMQVDEDDEDSENGTENTDVSEATTMLKNAAIAAETASAVELLPPVPLVDMEKNAATVLLPPSTTGAPSSGDASHSTRLSLLDSKVAGKSATLGSGVLPVLRTTEDFSRYFATIGEPCARIHACAMMRGASMMIYGGVTEANDVEITLDDCWALDINKRDVWRQLLTGSMHTLEWKGVEDDDHSRATDMSHPDDDSDDDDNDDDDVTSSDESSSSSSSDSDSSSDDDDEDGDSKGRKKISKKSKKSKKSKNDSKEEKQQSKKKKEKRFEDDTANGDCEEVSVDNSRTLADDGQISAMDRHANSNNTAVRRSNARHGGRRTGFDTVREELSLGDLDRTPQASESLRDFYARTAEYWATKVLEQWTAENAGNTDNILSELSEKEIKRRGFALAGERYEELLPILTQLNAMEAEQKVDEDRHRGKEKQSSSKSKDKDRSNNGNGGGSSSGKGMSSETAKENKKKKK